MNNLTTMLHGTVSVQDILSYIQSDYYMTKTGLSYYLSISPRTIENFMDEIPHYKLGRRVLFRKSEIDQWMQGHHQAPDIGELKAIADEAVSALRND